MKIRTQLVLGAALFGVVLVVIAASMVTTTAELGRLERQVQVADRIGIGANDLSYLSNEYLLYGEPQQAERWEARYAALGDDLANLSARTPAQQALVAAITEDRLRVKSVFDGIAADRPPGPADPATLPVSWSRVGVQTQGLAYDASRLSDLLNAEANGVQSLNTLLVAILLGAFAAVLLTSYFVVGGRTIRSLSTVLAGARVVGSGDLEHEIPVTGDDEVAELSHEFNRMTADLRTITASRAELEEAERAVREREQTLQSIFRAAPVGIGISSHRVMRSANEHLCRMTGYAADELVGHDARMLYSSDEAYAHAGEEKYAQTLEDGIGAVETQWRRKDGGFIDILLSSSPMDSSAPNENVVFIALDITNLHEKEVALREYAENLRRSNEDLERFAYVSSHDLQEPLRAIVSFSQLLERRYRGQLGSDADEYIEFIVEGGVRMQTLIQDLLAYSRVNTKQQELRPTSMEDVMAAVERSLDLQLHEAGAVLTHDPLPTVPADPLQLEQVFVNLISNAIKFRRPDEPLLVHVGARKTDGVWEFSVKDNGIGIEKEYFDRIFVIFQRLHTKDAYPGTGIGLAIVKRIIDRHGGRVWVESTPGEGSTFFFTLPAA
jgi:PAS domain S-box-containing protein